jgi:hypothetical protein
MRLLVIVASFIAVVSSATCGGGVVCNKSVRIQRIVAPSLDTADLAQIFAVVQQRQPVDQPVRLLIRVPEAVGEAFLAMGSVPTLDANCPP